MRLRIQHAAEPALPARLRRQIARDQHRQDRQHLLEQGRIEAAGLRRLPGYLAADFLRSEDLPEDIVALADFGRFGPDDVAGEPGAAKRVEDRAEAADPALAFLADPVAEPLEDRRQQRLGALLGLLARDTELAGDRVDAALRAENVGEVQRCSPIVVRPSEP